MLTDLVTSLTFGDLEEGRDGLAGVVIEDDAVGVDCLLLDPAIGKIENNVHTKIYCCFQNKDGVLSSRTLFVGIFFKEQFHVQLSIFSIYLHSIDPILTVYLTVFLLIFKIS